MVGRDTPQIRLKVKPYSYQREGILYGLKNKRLIVADEPGLGKTLQSIGIVNTANAYPCLVVCPSSLKINWQREFERFSNVNALVLNDSVISTFPYLLQSNMYQVVITNYESLRKFFVWDIKKPKGFTLQDIVFSNAIRLFKSVIIDESHRVKDASTQQAKFMKGITAGKPYVIMLSGTPVVNRPSDLIAQLSIINRLPEFGGATSFKQRYCEDPTQQSLRELSDKLYQSCMIRREKEKVLTELPDKTRVKMFCSLTRDYQKMYHTAERDLAAYLREYEGCTDWEVKRKMRMKALVQFMKLRELATLSKVNTAIEFIQDFLESGKSLVIFCALHTIVNELKEAFPTAVSVTGRDSANEKQSAVDSFQKGNSQLIICSIKAAGVGLTLTKSSTVLFIELPWTYADCCQCEDRTHRIGQKNNVTCYYLLAERTIDLVIYRLINEKKNTAAQILNADDNIPTQEEYFNRLITLFQNKEI